MDDLTTRLADVALLAEKSGEHDVEAAVLLILQGRQLPSAVRQRLVNLVAEAVRLAEAG